MGRDCVWIRVVAGNWVVILQRELLNVKIMFMLRKKKDCGDENESVDSAAAANGQLLVSEEENDRAEDGTPGPESESEASEEADEHDETEYAVETDNSDNGAMLAAFKAWLEDSMPEKERREAALSAMSTVCDSLCGGKYDETVFDIIAKGADYGRAVSEAEHVGEVRGRNASIDELMAMEKEDDGVPHPGSGGGDIGNSMPSIFDLAREAY